MYTHTIKYSIAVFPIEVSCQMQFTGNSGMSSALAIAEEICTRLLPEEKEILKHICPNNSDICSVSEIEIRDDSNKRQSSYAENMMSMEIANGILSDKY